MDTVTTLKEKFFQKPAAEITTSVLEKFVEDYPYNALAQFYLLRDYQKNKNPKAEQQALKTALYFNNTNWLEYQLRVPEDDNSNTTTTVSSTSEHQVQLPEEYNKGTISTSSTLEHQLRVPEDDIAQALTPEPLIAFEPLHTVDYFASQGIRIPDATLTGDKLGRQMKSFTEWLKTMKKVHPGKPAEAMDSTDAKIQGIAEGSNTSGEVVTEAMAEVLVMQGKAGKAAETYTKLSLLYPAKSAYFAAKIDSLKAE